MSHWQSRAVVIVTCPSPPSAPNDVGDADTVVEHFDVGPTPVTFCDVDVQPTIAAAAAIAAIDAARMTEQYPVISTTVTNIEPVQVALREAALLCD